MISNETASKLFTLTKALPERCAGLARTVVNDLPESVCIPLLHILSLRVGLNEPLSRADMALLTVMALRGNRSADAQIEVVKAFATLAECERTEDARIVLNWIARVEALIASDKITVH